MKRFNKTNGMYALLVAVAAMIGITIYGSCSADEDYGDYSSRDELFTLADGEMNLRSEEQGTVMFIGDSIPAGQCRVCSLELYKTTNPYYVPEARSEYTADVVIRWETGWTGNQTWPHSTTYFNLLENNPNELDSIVYRDNTYFNYVHRLTQSGVEGDWITHDKLKITIKIWCSISKYYYNIYNHTTGSSAPWDPNEQIPYPQLIRFYETFDYDELLGDTIIY